MRDLLLLRRRVYLVERHFLVSLTGACEEREGTMPHPLPVADQVAIKHLVEKHGLQVIYNELQLHERAQARTRHRYVCSSCGVNPVDADQGYDTCAECLKRI